MGLLYSHHLLRFILFDYVDSIYKCYKVAILLDDEDNQHILEFTYTNILKSKIYIFV